MRVIINNPWPCKIVNLLLWIACRRFTWEGGGRKRLSSADDALIASCAGPASFDLSARIASRSPLRMPARSSSSPSLPSPACLRARGAGYHLRIYCGATDPSAYCRPLPRGIGDPKSIATETAGCGSKRMVRGAKTQKARVFMLASLCLSGALPFGQSFPPHRLTPSCATGSAR